MLDHQWEFDVIFSYDSGLDRDVSVNTWHVDSDGDDSVVGPYWGPKIGEFYYTDTDYLGTDAAIIDYYSPLIDYTSMRVRLYSIVPSPPFHRIFYGETLVGPLTETQTVPFPSEVALCCSFNAQLSGETQHARRKGRVYLGPFGATGTTAEEGTTGRPIPSAALLNHVAIAGERLTDYNAVSTSSEGKLCIFSRAAEDFRPIVGGWVDNEWDTQRRRGTDATARLSW